MGFISYISGENNKMKKIVCLSLCLFVGSVNAALIDFEGVAPDSTQLAVGNNYVEEGFNLFNPGASIDAAIIGQPFQNTTGSDYYTWNSNSVNNPITLTSLLGSTFDLFSLDVGTKNNILGSFNITGFFSGGSSLVYNVINASAFTGINLNWSNLDRVEFSYVAGDFGAIDNLVVESTSVPVPASIALFAFGLAGLGFFRQRKTA